MSTSLSKRSSSHWDHLDKVSSVDGALTRSALKHRIVEKATNLGNGYIIVKVGAPGTPTVASDSELPAIPKGQVRRILARYTGDEMAVATAKARPSKTAPEDNAQLMAVMNDEAMARRQALHERGDLLTSAQISARLGVSRQALSKAISERRMFWVDGAKGAQWYPSFFTDAMIDRRMLEQVSVALGDLPGAVKWQFFTTPKHSLGGRTPIDAVRAGALEQVLRTAVEVMERNLGR